MSTTGGPAFHTRVLALLAVLATFVSAGFAALVVAAFVISTYDGIPGSPLAFGMVYLYLYGAIALVTGVYVYLHGGRSMLDVDAPSMVDLRDALVGFLVVILGVTVLAVLANVLGIPVLDRGVLGTPISPPSLLVAVPLTIAVGVPAQELLFRNVCQKRLATVFPIWVAVGVPSLLMVGLTLSTFATAPVTGLVYPALAVALASVTIGVLYDRTGNLVVAWLLHSALSITLISLLYLVATTALDLGRLF